MTKVGATDSEPGQPRESKEVEDPLLELIRELKVGSGDLARTSWLGEWTDGVLLGPTGVGKTSFLAALPAACGEVDDLEIQLIPGLALGDLIGDGATSATLNSKIYDFQVHFRSTSASQPATGNGVAGAEDSLHVSITDTRGLDLDSRPGLQASLSLAKSASWLILLADASNPKPTFWRYLIPRLVAALAEGRRDATVRLARGIEKPAAGSPAAVALERRLPQQRILLLLSKIDIAVAESLAELRQEKDFAFGPLATHSPDLFARHIEVVPTITLLFGEALSLLRSALPRDASLAVGLVSHTGFSAHKWQPSRPFGVREALMFLAKGRCEWPVVPISSFKDLDLSGLQGAVDVAR